MKTGKRFIALLVTVTMTCLLATGCMGGKKDISKDDEEKYNAVVAAACEEYGYEFEKETVFPLGAELLYSLTNGEDDVEITVNIDEESVSGKVSCQFDIVRYIASEEDRVEGLEQHLDVLIKIAEHFTEDITKADVVAFLNDEESWTESEDETVVMYKEKDAMKYIISEDGDGLEEHFSFGWDNGKKYSLKN